MEINMKISEQTIRRLCSPVIYKRGVEYFNEGRVHLKKKEQQSVTAVIDGEAVYSTSIKFSDEGSVDYCFCTCPYFETMGSVCKHIVAAALQFKSELEGIPKSTDENERISSEFLTEFIKRNEQQFAVPVKFEICLRKNDKSDVGCGIRIFIADTLIENPEDFLECCVERRLFKTGKKYEFIPGNDTFTEAEWSIISVLAESYESRKVRSEYYIKVLGEIPVGGKSAERIVALISQTDYNIVMDRVDLGRVPVIVGNPEIFIDISAMFNEITVFSPDYGTSITPSGSVFYYEGALYITDVQWINVFMPLYHAFDTDKRTQITFKNKNALSFASNVLPDMKKLSGIVTEGLDEYIINERPEFTVFIDYSNMNIRCKLKASYGTVSLSLPENDSQGEYIVVRDVQAENELIDLFSDFSFSSGYYHGKDSDVIFDFITNRMPKLKKKYDVLVSDAFSELKLKSEIGISAQIMYNPDINLLEAVPDIKLSSEEIREIYNAIEFKKKFYRSMSGEFYNLDTVKNELKLFDFVAGKHSGESVQLPKYNILYLYAAAEAYGKEKINCSEEVSEYVEKLKNVKAVIPDELKNTLRDYQKTGMDWMKQLSMLGFGGILADDMGLGKTVQMLAFLYGEKREKPALIVTPAALTYNWLHEVNKFLPSASVIIIDGTKEERLEKINKINEYDFVVVSYTLLRRDIDEYNKLRFSFCVLDEAQAIKNPGTMNAKSVKSIKAECRFALTGTPIENSLRELWSIFDFLIPGYLGSFQEFHTDYEVPAVKEGDDEAISALKTKIKPFILRRMKKDVLSELPDKIEEVVYAKMTEEQEKVYVAYRAIAKDKAEEAIGVSGKANIEVLTLLLRLRQISCHPSLFDSAYKKESGKLNLLYEQLETAIASGHRILVFSQFTSMLSIISAGLRERGITYFYIDGATPAQKRIEYADGFNAGKNDVFLISLKAGGTGLNLTGADTVIHYDPWWNPAVTDQASDRAYRIGQTKNVHVIRLASENSIESKIIQLQEKKRSLAKDIININSESLTGLSNEEILSLFD